MSYYKSSLVVFFASIVFCFSLLYYYFNQSYNDLWNYKYVIPAVISILILTFLLVAVFFVKLDRFLIFSFFSIPFFSWGSSVVIFDMGSVYISFFVLVWIMVLFKALSVKTKSYFKLEDFKFWMLLLMAYFLSMATVFLHTPIPWGILVTGYISPLIFVVSLVRISLVFSQSELNILVVKLIKCSVLSVVIMIFIETVVRSGGQPWIFLINGARSLYSGTEGDVTGGLGEPVTMGLWASALSIIVFYFYIQGIIAKNDFTNIFVVLVAISLFSLSRSSMMITLAVIFSLSIYLKGNFRKWILLSMPLIFPVVYYVFLNRLSTESGQAIGEFIFGDNFFVLELNLAIYLNNITGWMNGDGFYLSPILQALLLPFIGGETNIEKVSSISFYYLMIPGFIFVLFSIFSILRLRASGLPILPYFVLFLMVYYYGAFGSTGYSFYYILDRPINLGYVPRELPVYLLITIFFYSWVVSRKKVGYESI